MDKQAFDEAIGEVPRSTVDIEAVLTRGRRAARFRLVANPWTATAAGVVAVIFGVITLLSGSSSGTPAGPTDSASAAPPQGSSCAAMTPTAPPVPGQPADTANRLTDVLTTLVRDQLAPGLTLAPNPQAESHGPLEFWHILSELKEFEGSGCAPAHDYFMAKADVFKGQAGDQGYISVAIGRLGGDPSPHTECGAPAEETGVDQDYSCERRTGPNGEIILVSRDATRDGSATSNVVQVTKTDGTGMILFATNTDEVIKAGQPPLSPAPPLTTEQLVAIGLDPGLTLYP